MCHFVLDLRSSRFPRRFRTKIMYAFLSPYLSWTTRHNCLLKENLLHSCYWNFGLCPLLLSKAATIRISDLPLSSGGTWKGENIHLKDLLGKELICSHAPAVGPTRICSDIPPLQMQTVTDETSETSWVFSQGYGKCANSTHDCHHTTFSYSFKLEEWRILYPENEGCRFLWNVEILSLVWLHQPS